MTGFSKLLLSTASVVEDCLETDFDDSTLISGSNLRRTASLGDSSGFKSAISMVGHSTGYVWILPSDS